MLISCLIKPPYLTQERQLIVSAILIMQQCASLYMSPWAPVQNRQLEERMSDGPYLRYTYFFVFNSHNGMPNRHKR